MRARLPEHDRLGAWPEDRSCDSPPPVQPFPEGADAALAHGDRGSDGLCDPPGAFRLDDIDQLTLPCILHWDLSHYVVLVAANRRRIVVHDPAHGRRSYSLAAASDHVTGVALEVTPSATFRPESNAQKLRISDFWSRSQGVGRSIAYVGACIVLVELCSIIYPFVSQLIVDTAIANGDTKLVFVVALAFVALLLLRSSTTVVRSLLMVRLSTSINYQMEVNLFKHLLRLPTSFFERREWGDDHHDRNHHHFQPGAHHLPRKGRAPSHEIMAARDFV